jgi:hypothetical protein
MPSLDPLEPAFKVGSRQRREENLRQIVSFLESVKKTTSHSENEWRKVAERFSDTHFQYGYVTRKDISEQALILTNLF